MLKNLVIAALVLSMLFARVVADDTAINKVGGTIAIMHEHPTIRLEAEQVCILVHRRSAEVECTFRLHNDGPGTSVLVGFPDFSDPSLGHFDNFESQVDGKKVDVELVQQANGESWWTKTIVFEEGETKEIIDRYTGGISFDTGGLFWFSYLLYTGGSWAGTIGSAKIVVRFVDFDLDQIHKITPANYEAAEREISWIFTDFEPTKDSETAEIRIEWRDTPQTRIDSELHRAAALGDIESVRHLLESGANVDSVGDYGMTPLRAAIRYASGPKMIAFLLESGGDANRYANGWDTPLHEAVRQDYGPVVDVVRILLEHGADINARAGSPNGRTTLGLAMESPCPAEVVGLLIARGADVNATDAAGTTALHWGCLSDVSRRQPSLDSAYRLAYEKIEIALAHGANPNVVDKQGHTPLDYAKTEEIRSLLMAHGALSGKDIGTRQK